ncbi:MAG TPA: crotonase/enoyl-CoA hydratase family protein [Acidimicrobiales bacterium]
MGYTCFDVSESDHVAHIQLSRPDKLNSMIPEFWMELPAIVKGISAEGRARAIVISSTGRHFSAGMDLAVFTGGSLAAQDGDAAAAPRPPAEQGRARARLRESALMLQDSFTALEKARMPVIAAIQGGCIGGAVDMVTACDLRYATEDAFFVIQEINIGMTADVGTLQRLPKLIPDAIVRELAYLGGRMPARRAYEVGLLNGVFASHDELVAGALDTAAQIAAKSPLAIWGSKEMITYARDHTVADALNYIATWQTGMFQPADMMESFLAKAEGRDPVFDDLLSTPDDF